MMFPFSFFHRILVEQLLETLQALGHTVVNETEMFCLMELPVQWEHQPTCTPVTGTAPLPLQLERQNLNFDARETWFQLMHQKLTTSKHIASGKFTLTVQDLSFFIH